MRQYCVAIYDYTIILLFIYIHYYTYNMPFTSDQRVSAEKLKVLYFSVFALCTISTATQFLIWTGITSTFYDSTTGAAVHPMRFLDWIVTFPTTTMMLFLM